MDHALHPERVAQEVVSSTYADLVAGSEDVAALTTPEEWDNKTICEQRDWLLKIVRELIREGKMVTYRATIHSAKLNPTVQVFHHNPDYLRGWIRDRLAELKDPEAAGALVEISEKEIACFHYDPKQQATGYTHE